MDFRFRAIDNQPPAAPSGYKCPSDPPPRVDSSVERRIREEITIRETARRRMLEVEIRREIIMEQELAILRVMAREQTTFDDQLISMKSLDRRLNHIVDQSGKSNLSAVQVQLDSSSQLNSSLVLPFTEPRPKPTDDDQKDKLVFLTRPDPKQFEAKRKAKRLPTATEGEADAGTEPLGWSSKKAKQDQKECFFCKTCQNTSTSQTSFDAPSLGKKHWAKSEAICSDGLQIASKVLEKTAAPEQESENTGAKESGLENKGLFKFWCEVCQIGTHSRTVMKDHNMGRKHRARLLKLGHSTEDRYELANPIP